jgi:hypothetical protein
LFDTFLSGNCCLLDIFLLGMKIFCDTKLDVSITVFPILISWIISFFYALIKSISSTSFSLRPSFPFWRTWSLSTHF